MSVMGLECRWVRLVKHIAVPFVHIGDHVEAWELARVGMVRRIVIECAMQLAVACLGGVAEDGRNDDRSAAAAPFFVGLLLHLDGDCKACR